MRNKILKIVLVFTLLVSCFHLSEATKAAIDDVNNYIIEIIDSETQEGISEVAIKYYLLGESKEQLGEEISTNSNDEGKILIESEQAKYIKFTSVKKEGYHHELNLHEAIELNDDIKQLELIKNAELDGVSVTAKEELVYNGEEQELVKVICYENDKVTYQVDGEELSSAKKTDAGIYHVKVSIERDDIKFEEEVDVQIAKAKIDLKLEGVQNLFTNEVQEIVSLEGELFDTDDVTWLVNDEIIGEDLPTATNPREYKIQLKVNRGSNYEEYVSEVNSSIKYAEQVKDGYTIEGNKGQNDWFRGEVSITPIDGYKIAKEDLEFKNDIVFDQQKKYENEKIYLQNKETKAICEPYELNFSIDNNAPIGKMNIELSEEKLNFYEIFGKVFGFYKPNVVMTFSYICNNEVSNIDKFIYTYTKDEEASSNQVDTFTQPINEKEGLSYEIEKDTYYYELVLDDGYRGTFSFVVEDEAGNQSNPCNYDYSADEDLLDKVVVVDSTAPIFDIEYEKEVSKYNEYLIDQNEISATLKITEDNFFSEDVKVKVNGEITDLDWQLNKDTSNQYIADLTFNDENDYKIEIIYSDRSGNVMTFNGEPKEVIELNWIIDRTDPKITVNFDHNEYVAKQDEHYYYNKKRVATITVNEPHLKDKKIQVTAVDINGNELNTYKNELNTYKIEELTLNDKGEYEGKIEMDGNAIYSFNVECSDYAGKTAIYEEKEFTIDNSEPTIIDVKYSKSVYDVIIEKLTFHYYQAPVKVTVTASNNISGIESITCKAKSIEGSQFEAEQITDLVVDEKDKGKVTVEFMVPKGELDKNNQFKGTIEAKALSKAKIEKSYDSDVLVVDNIAPVLTYEYSEEVNIVEGVYYHNDNLEYTFTITENNFFGEDVKLKVNDVEINDLVWQKTENLNEYQAKLIIDKNGHYNIEVSYTDRSGNIMKTFKSVEHVVDKVAPELEYEHSEQANVFGGRYYHKDNLKYTFTITEDNFFSEDVIVKVNDVEINDLDWQLNKDTSNQYIAELIIDKDGCYNIEVSYTDRSGNIMKIFKSVEHVVDKVAPQLSMPIIEGSLSLSERDQDFYSNDLVVSFTINEVNFDANAVEINVAENDSNPTLVRPTWEHNGDIHKAIFNISGDNRYRFTIDCADIANNKIEHYVSKTLVIDTEIIEPTITINGINSKGDSGAYSGDNIEISYSLEDINIATQNIKLIRSNLGNQEDVTDQFIHLNNEGTSYFGSFEIPKEKVNDGIYELQVSMQDKAGHTSETTSRFVVNRYGSVYEYSDELIKLIKDGGQYVQGINDDLVIIEYSASALTDEYEVMLQKDLAQGFYVNPDLEHNISASGWHEYRYKFSKDLFEDEGTYILSLRTNYKTNDNNEGKTTTPTRENTFSVNGEEVKDQIKFTVDKTAPTIEWITNLEEHIVGMNKIKNGILDVEYSISDLYGISSIEVYVNDIVTKIDSFDDRYKYDGSFELQESQEEQTVRIVVTDLAGNITDTSKEECRPNDFNDKVVVSTNPWVRFTANKPLLYGTVIVAITVAAIGVIVVISKKKDNISE